MVKDAYEIKVFDIGIVCFQILFKKGVPLLMPNKSGARGIHTAASKGHVAVVNSLIVKGENVDAATNVNIATRPDVSAVNDG